VRIVNTLAVCDPEPVVMEGLRSLMEAIDGPRVVVVETRVEDAAERMRALEPSMLVVDKGFGTPVLMEWLRMLSKAEKPTAVIVWGMMMSESEALRFLQAGASGVVRKNSPLSEIGACIKTVAAGGTWMENDVVRDTFVHSRPKRSTLTPRELQVTELVERGYKNKEIGQSLGIRTGTVKIHLKHIFEKTGIRGRYGLAISGLKNKGLLVA
jgi:two-component system, NarL family, nitrate/nitrite response regulator NarL